MGRPPLGRSQSAPGTRVAAFSPSRGIELEATRRRRGTRSLSVHPNTLGPSLKAKSPARADFGVGFLISAACSIPSQADCTSRRLVQPVPRIRRDGTTGKCEARRRMRTTTTIAQTRHCLQALEWCVAHWLRVPPKPLFPCLRACLCGGLPRPEPGPGMRGTARCHHRLRSALCLSSAMLLCCRLAL